MLILSIAFVGLIGLLSSFLRKKDEKDYFVDVGPADTDNVRRVIDNGGNRLLDRVRKLFRDRD